MIDFNTKLTKNNLIDLGELIQDLARQAGYTFSARGWCYMMETRGMIDKSQFDKVSNAINRGRKLGIIPVDCVAEEEARKFYGVIQPSHGDPARTIIKNIEEVVDSEWYYIPDYYANEKYYIQMVVEKVDLVTLFQPICLQYKIPIANSKGWSSILQRAQYTERFRLAEEDGKQCVLLYYGDHDPDGLRISDTLYKNLSDLKHIQWSDGRPGYDSKNLIIDRVGLSYNTIKQLNLTWIDNLITGGTKNGKHLDLSDKSHKNYSLKYVQDYLKAFGAKKCEANAIVVKPREAQNILRRHIEKYLDPNVLDRFDQKRDAVGKRIDTVKTEVDLEGRLRELTDDIDELIDDDNWHESVD